jgi:CspA family cold shock protein
MTKSRNTPIEGNSDDGAGRLEGIVKRLVADRGFGFVQAEGLDYFVHKDDLANGQIEDLAPGTTVSFIPETTAKGPRGRAVTILRGGR